MKMWIEIEGIAETLNDGHRTPVDVSGVQRTHLFPDPVAYVPEPHPKDQPQHLAQ